MSAQDPRREAARDFMRELLEEAEIAWIESLTPEQMEEEARGSGLASGEALEMLRRAIDAADAPETAPAAPAEAPTKSSAEPAKSNVLSFERARARRRTAYIALAAAAAVAVTIGAIERKPIGEQIQAWFSPAPTTPVPVPVPPPLMPPTHEETPLEKARRLREQAYVDIQKWYFDYAWDELLEAKELDFDGDKDPRVQQAYRDIDKGAPKPPMNMSKAPVEFYERPLKKQPPTQH